MDGFQDALLGALGNNSPPSYKKQDDPQIKHSKESAVIGQDRKGCMTFVVPFALISMAVPAYLGYIQRPQETKDFYEAATYNPPPGTSYGVVASNVRLKN